MLMPDSVVGKPSARWLWKFDVPLDHSTWSNRQARVNRAAPNWIRLTGGSWRSQACAHARVASGLLL